MLQLILIGFVFFYPRNYDDKRLTPLKKGIDNLYNK